MKDVLDQEGGDGAYLYAKGNLDLKPAARTGHTQTVLLKLPQVAFRPNKFELSRWREGVLAMGKLLMTIIIPFSWERTTREALKGLT